MHELAKTKNLKATCSFCKKGQDEVRRLVSGFGAIICDECVQLCQELFAAVDDPPYEFSLLSKLQVAQIVSRELCVTATIKPEDFSRCEFSIISPGGGGAPIIHVEGGGKLKGRSFYFSLRSRVWGDECGLVMNHVADLEARWE